jgi:hypothetical protein
MINLEKNANIPQTAVGAPTTTDIGNVYDFATNLLLKRTPPEQVKQILESHGIEKFKAAEVVTTLVKEMQTDYSAPANGNGAKDMLFGAMWCIGGIIMTASDSGYIFWGAIVFGAIQFFRGLMDSK